MKRGSFIPLPFACAAWDGLGGCPGGPYYGGQCCDGSLRAAVSLWLRKMWWTRHQDSEILRGAKTDDRRPTSWLHRSDLQHAKEGDMNAAKLFVPRKNQQAICCCFERRASPNTCSERPLMRVRLLSLAIVLLSACTPKPQSYEDCVLKFVKPNLSDRGALLVADACQRKFAEPAEALELHPLDE